MTKKAMKGITPVLSLILLIIIVIVVIGFSFAFFGNLISSTTGAAEEQTQQQTEQITKTVNIVGISGNQVLVKSASADQIINTTEISVYFINSTSGAVTLLNCNWSPSTIQPQQTATCTFSVTCTSPDKIKVVSPSGIEAVKTC